MPQGGASVHARPSRPSSRHDDGETQGRGERGCVDMSLTAHVVSYSVTPAVFRGRGPEPIGGGPDMAAGRRTVTATRQRVATVAPAAAKSEPDAVDPAFHRAILKIALELKKPSAREYDAIVERTIRAMKLDPVAFRRYLGENGARNMSLLLATARGPG